MQYSAKAVALFLLFVMLSGCAEDAVPQSEPAGVRYSVVAEERITLTSDLPGRVSALVVSEVRPQVDGIIQERLFEEGADVQKGQVLYQIDPAIYQATYNTAKAALAEAEANAEALALLEKRYRNLVKTNAVSRQDLDNAVSEYSQARARIARAKAELESAAINLGYTQIKAPVSGRIGASTVTSGALVTANQSTALAVIQQTDRVYVDITQPSAATIHLRRAMAQGSLSTNGSAAKVRLMLEDGSPYTLASHGSTNDEPEWILGDLLFSEISVGQTTGSVSLRSVFNNPDGLLLPGMYVTATIEEGALDKAVLIPQSSVLSSGSGGHMVYVLQEDASGQELFRVERREVEFLRTYGNRWILKSGLNAGELLVVEGLQKAVPGELVKGLTTPASVAGLPAQGGASDSSAPSTRPETR